ncbi:MAG TPA: hypothetical protein VF715_04355 [Thermoleophilaceae bacterium]|jgi:hypothetical protein
MTDSSARGDAAYREEKNAIAARNDAARKAGREQRAAADKKAATRRAEDERAEMSDLRHTFGGNTAH